MARLSIQLKHVGVSGECLAEVPEHINVYTWNGSLMDKITSERRQTLRCELRTRVHLYVDQTDSYENAHLENINYTGMYLMTRRKLAMDQEFEIAMPPDNAMDEPLKIKAKVMRYGKHRSWGLFSYACRILHSS